jgi:hypothetical protein
MIANDDEDSGGKNNVQFGDVYADVSGANMTFEIRTRLIVGGAKPGSRSRWAGYARNRAASLRYLLFPDNAVECEDGVEEEEEEEEDDDDDVKYEAPMEAMGTRGGRGGGRVYDTKKWVLTLLHSPKE